MTKLKKFNVILIISLILLAIFNCFSIILTTLNTDPKTTTTNNVLCIVYLFFNFIVLAFCFYESVIGMNKGSKFMFFMMLEENGKINKSARIKALVIAGIGFIFTVYGILLLTGLQIPLSFFSLGLKYSIVNAGLGLSVGGISFYLFPNFYEKKEFENIE